MVLEFYVERWCDDAHGPHEQKKKHFQKKSEIKNALIDLLPAVYVRSIEKWSKTMRWRWGRYTHGWIRKENEKEEEEEQVKWYGKLDRREASN